MGWPEWGICGFIYCNVFFIFYNVYVTNVYVGIQCTNIGICLNKVYYYYYLDCIYTHMYPIVSVTVYMKNFEFVCYIYPL